MSRRATATVRDKAGPSWASGYRVGRGLRFSVVVDHDIGREIVEAARRDGISASAKMRRLLAQALDGAE